MSEDGNKVECGEHGQRDATFVCQHLAEGAENLGFNVGYDEDDPDAHYPDAWCGDCEKAWQAEGEWNDKSEAFAQIKVVCSDCYELIRSNNWKQDNKAWDDLVTSACVSHSEKQDKFLADFAIGDHDRWDRDQDTGVLVFSNEGQPQVEAEFHVAGSMSLKSNTWMWAWANESLSEQVRLESRRVRDFGDTHGYLPLSAHLVDASEEETGHFTAIMVKHLDAIGSYRTLENDLYTYMVITKARWVKKKKLFGLFG